MAEKPSKESLELIAKRIVESANREICRANAPSLTAWPPFHDEVYVRIIVAELRQQNAAMVSALRKVRFKKCEGGVLCNSRKELLKIASELRERDKKIIQMIVEIPLSFGNAIEMSARINQIIQKLEFSASYAPAEAEAKEKP